MEKYILPSIDVEEKILVIGCGNSQFSEKLYGAGYRNITNIDISETLIANMTRVHADKPKMKWEKMNMLEMTFDSNIFDVAIDKATMDVLQCDNEDSWNPSEEVQQRVNLFYKNCERVLKSHGKLLQISFDQPHFRRKYVDNLIWNLGVKTINEGSLPYYLYILDKFN